MECAVFFNLDGTLIDHDLDYESIYLEAVEECGLSQLEDAYEQYTDRFFQYFQDGWTFPRRQAFLDVLQDHDMEDLGHSDRFAEAWEEAEADRAEALPGAVDVIQQLSRSFTLGIATNGTGGLQRRKLDEAGMGQYFDVVLVSSEIGVAKPHADFFDRARSEVDADECIMVSEDLRRDILPAKREEFLTVWVSAEEGNAQVEQLVDERAASLDDVPAAVERLCS